MSENTGQGSSGGWRLDDANPTADLKAKIKNEHKAGKGEQAGRIKLGAYEHRRCEKDSYQPIGVRAQRRQATVARMHGNLKPMRFVSLHHHTTYSFLDGFQLPEAHVRRATEINMQGICFTEHGNIFSHVKGEKAALEAGVKPIFGCEFYTMNIDKPTQKKNHLTVIAETAEGYANLLKLVTLSWKEGFYYDPAIDPRWLVEHKKGLIVLSGCQSSALFTAVAGGKHVEERSASKARGLKVARWFKRHFGDKYFIEVQAFPELRKTCEANPVLAEIAERVGVSLVATMDVHYTAPEEGEIQQILHSCRPGEKRTVEQMVQDWGYDVPLCPPPNDKAIFRRLQATGLTKEQAIEAIVSTEEIYQQSSVTLPRLPRVTFPLPEGYEDTMEVWRDWLRKGWLYRGCDKLPKKERDEYRAQLHKEMEIIEDKEFHNYFLIVADAVQFAKNEQIPVGPARGSAAASLCCWLLRITEVNPMLFSDLLVFERFIDWNREDLPDIDLDFATYGRPLVRDYLLGKYGEGCVNNIGTFTMYKPKLALDDAARVHNVPFKDVETVKELLLERSSGDLRASATIEDTVDQFDEVAKVFDEHPMLRHSMDLEGNAKGFGIHAAGLVISTGPITEVAAVLEKMVEQVNIDGIKEKNLVQVVSMDKYDAERQGLEKLDFLALSTMDMVAEALRNLGMKIEELYDIPLDDKKTMEGFRRNDVVGTFQWDGRATRIVNGMLVPDDFRELAIVNALSRPGPLHNGAASAYVKIKHGAAEHESIHPALDLITAPLKYQIIFQEQILRIVREIGNFDWTHAAYIRKIISRKLGDAEFNRQWQRFLDGALTVHERMDVPPMNEEQAKLIWGGCITAGSYAFNAAHSIAYSMLAFWTMWLKQHHPAEGFYAPALAKMPNTTGGTSRGSRSRHETLLHDAYAHGIEIRSPDPSKSGYTWQSAGKRAILAGWSQVPGLGPAKGIQIAEALKEDHHRDLTEIKGIGPATVEKINAFIEQPDPFNIHTLAEQITAIKKQIEDGELDLPLPTHTAEEAIDAPGRTVITFMGMPVYRNLRDIFEANRAKTGEALDPKNVQNPDKREWVMMSARDNEEIVSLCFPRLKYPRFREAIWKMNLNQDLVLIRGKKAATQMGDWAGASNRVGLIYVDDMWVIDPREEEEDAPPTNQGRKRSANRNGADRAKAAA